MMWREIGGSFSTAGAVCTRDQHLSPPSSAFCSCPTYKLTTVITWQRSQRLTIGCVPLDECSNRDKHLFLYFNSGSRLYIDRIIDTVIEQLLLRGRREANEACVSGWQTASSTHLVHLTISDRSSLERACSRVNVV